MGEFDKYVIYYHSAPQYGWDARVILSRNSTLVADLMFMKNGQALPRNRMEGAVAKVWFSTVQLPAILDILRHEKPLFFNLVASNGIATISTSSEPVGELDAG